MLAPTQATVAAPGAKFAPNHHVGCAPLAIRIFGGEHGLCHGAGINAPRLILAIESQERVLKVVELLAAVERILGWSRSTGGK